MFPVAAAPSSLASLYVCPSVRLSDCPSDRLSVALLIENLVKSFFILLLLLLLPLGFRSLALAAAAAAVEYRGYGGGGGKRSMSSAAAVRVRSFLPLSMSFITDGRSVGGRGRTQKNKPLLLAMTATFNPEIDVVVGTRQASEVVFEPRFAAGHPRKENAPVFLKSDVKWYTHCD